MWRVVLALLAGCGFEGHGRSSNTPIDAPDEPVIDSAIDAPAQSWWDSQFKRRRLIELDGTKLAGPVTQLPVLIAITNHSGIAANGADLRFVNFENNTPFAHEIERYDTSGTSYIWVRIGAMPAAKLQLWMYYGNSAASSTSSGADVFASSFVSVHHLASFTDATGHGHNANPLPTNTPAVTNSGRIGQARDFDGTNDYIKLSGEAAFDFTTSLYASAWVRINGFDVVYQAIVTKGDFAWRMQRANNTQFSQFGTNDGQNLDGDKRIDDDAWHLVAINYDGMAKQVYVDGALDSNMAYSTTLANTTVAVRFGMNEESTLGGARWWNGLMDEVRISGQPRTAAWIGAEYITVNDPAFVTIGTEQMYMP